MFARVLCGLLLVSPLSPLWASAAEEAHSDPDHVGLKTEIVGIATGRLTPTVKLVGSTEALGWINYTSRVASIEFDAAVAEGMMCTGPTPFRLAGDRLVAERIASGGFATLCKLAPGEYDYRVTLRGAKDPFLGKLVVSPTEATP